MGKESVKMPWKIKCFARHQSIAVVCKWTYEKSVHNLPVTVKYRLDYSAHKKYLYYFIFLSRLTVPLKFHFCELHKLQWLKKRCASCCDGSFAKTFFSNLEFSVWFQTNYIETLWPSLSTVIIVNRSVHWTPPCRVTTLDCSVNCFLKYDCSLTFLHWQTQKLTTPIDMMWQVSQHITDHISMVGLSEDTFKES